MDWNCGPVVLEALPTESHSLPDYIHWTKFPFSEQDDDRQLQNTSKALMCHFEKSWVIFLRTKKSLGDGFADGLRDLIIQLFVTLVYLHEHIFIIMRETRWNEALELPRWESRKQNRERERIIKEKRTERR